jgi:hypothetical protein
MNLVNSICLLKSAHNCISEAERASSMSSSFFAGNQISFDLDLTSSDSEISIPLSFCSRLSKRTS